MLAQSRRDDLLAAPPSESTASPCLGGSASKGGLRPSRLCKHACDAASDKGLDPTAQIGSVTAFHIQKKTEDSLILGTLAPNPSRTHKGKQGSVERACSQNGDLRSPPDRRSLAVDASASRTAMPLTVHKYRGGDSHRCASVCICGSRKARRVSVGRSQRF
jgi:hypothetical protein